jgi:antitoxin component HigA of HigAB toxin-antitoxin module
MADVDSTDAVRARIFSKIKIEDDAQACWPWTGSANGKGYGAVCINGKRRAAHRVVYEICNGPIPPGLEIRHTCDNPGCVNPAHLLVGTHSQNMRDMSERGRTGGMILSDADVFEVRRLYLQCAVKQSDLASRFGVSKSAISSVVRGKNFARMGAPPAELLKAAYANARHRNGNPKMSPETVQKVRAEYAQGGVTMRALAAKHGASPMAICWAIKRKSWKRLE